MRDAYQIKLCSISSCQGVHHMRDQRVRLKHFGQFCRLCVIYCIARKLLKMCISKGVELFDCITKLYVLTKIFDNMRFVIVQYDEFSWCTNIWINHDKRLRVFLLSLFHPEPEGVSMSESDWAAISDFCCNHCAAIWFISAFGRRIWRQRTNDSAWHHAPHAFLSCGNGSGARRRCQNRRMVWSG